MARQFECDGLLRTYSIYLEQFREECAQPRHKTIDTFSLCGESRYVIARRGPDPRFAIPLRVHLICLQTHDGRIAGTPPRLRELRVSRMSRRSPAFLSSDMNVKRAAKYGFC